MLQEQKYLIRIYIVLKFFPMMGVIYTLLSIEMTPNMQHNGNTYFKLQDDGSCCVKIKY